MQNPKPSREQLSVVVLLWYIACRGGQMSCYGEYVCFVLVVATPPPSLDFSKAMSEKPSRTCRMRSS